MPATAPKQLLQMLLSLALGGLCGWLIEAGISGFLAGLGVAALLWLAWNIQQSWRLNRWLQEKDAYPPRSFGLWRSIFERLLRSRRQQLRELALLRDALDEFRSATNAFPEPVLLIDAKHVLLWYNDASVAQLGLRRGSDRGHVVHNLIRHPAFTDWLNQSDAPAQAQDAAATADSGVEIDSPTQPGQIFHVTRSPTESGRQLLIFRDTTEVHAVETMRRDFVANVSHELRTPLTVLVGYLETLADDIDPELEMILDRMRGQTQLMQNLIDDLIEISRLQSQQMNGREEQVDMRPLLLQLREQMESLSDGRHQIEFDIEPGLNLFGVSKDLESAITNLLTNAVRYTPHGGQIQLSWHLEERGAVLSVEDSGIGIPAKDIPRLTERFYRVAKDRSRSSGGSGLGLSIVKHVLNAHQAQLEITSQLGAGSCFRCIFPRERIRRSSTPA